tara:strand:+ start:274 stop:816 length:543 start_codon:yes stop_codon:yes gene_type:complete
MLQDKSENIIRQVAKEFVNNVLSKDEEVMSLDDWKPAPKKNVFRAPSKWRARQNKEFTANHFPDTDEFNKIKSYLKHGVKDDEITKTFNVSSKTLAKIKSGQFFPIGSIDSYNQEIQLILAKSKVKIYENRPSSLHKATKLKVEYGVFLLATFVGCADTTWDFYVTNKYTKRLVSNKSKE